MLGLDPWTVQGTLSQACYVFPKYVVWSTEEPNSGKASFVVGPHSPSMDAAAACKEVPTKKGVRYEGHFNGISGELGFAYAHEGRLRIFNVTSKKTLWTTDCDFSRPIQVEGDTLIYWKKEAMVALKDCPEKETELSQMLPPAFILNRHTALNLKTFKETKLPETRCVDPRPSMEG